MGMNGTQKIKKLFIDRKISRSERESIALLVDDESVLWIENLHLSERVKISSETKNVASLELLPLDEDKDLLSQENI
jgi:tRNA(Ile)-lysidine synthase